MAMFVLLLLYCVVATAVDAKDKSHELGDHFDKDFLYPAKPAKAKPSHNSGNPDGKALCAPVNCKSNEVCTESTDGFAKCIRKKSWKNSSFTQGTEPTRKCCYCQDRLHQSPSKKPAKLFAGPSHYQRDCPPCPVVHPVFICGSDNITYSSDCRLQYKNCEDNTSVKVACNGKCPCKSMDQSDLTVLKNSQKVETILPIKKHVMKESGAMVDNVEGSLKNNQIRIHSGGKAGGKTCTKKEMKDMRFRLIDWFYAVFRQKVEEGEPQDFVQVPVCRRGYNHAILSWMFLYFDDDKDDYLSMRELFDLEADKYEHCINPFLEFCDTDEDLDISGHEWCRCFQDKKQRKPRG